MNTSTATAKTLLLVARVRGQAGRLVPRDLDVLFKPLGLRVPVSQGVLSVS